METINLYIQESNSDTFWFHLFSKYSEKIYDTELNIDEFQTPYSEYNSKFETITNKLFFNYENHRINIIFSKDNFEFVKYNPNNFYIVTDYLMDFESNFINYNKSNKIYLSLEEVPFRNIKSENLIKLINNANCSIITSSNLESNNKNIFYRYQLSLIFFYYHLKFYHLPLDEIIIKKENLLGSYYRKGYRKFRDEFFENISNKINFKVYSIDYTEDASSIFDLKFNDGWFGNHITSYIDYLKSTCNIIFESDGDIHIDSFYHCTEKTLKGILFSKLNILFIYYANPKLVKELINDGYWFLNFEFIDKSKDIDYDNLKNSIYKSIEYLNKLNIELKNYNDVYTHLVEKYEHKMQNNYNLFTKLKTSNDLSKEILNFIIYKFKRNQSI